MIGFGLKNSFSSGFSSCRIQRSGPAVRRVERLVVEDVRRRMRRQRWQALRRALLAVVHQQVRPQGARVEEALELDAREFADLLLGVVDAALLFDARADLPHDLLDVNLIRIES